MSEERKDYFSREKIEKAVNQQVLSHPVGLSGLLVGGMSAFWMLLFGFSLPATALAVGGAVVFGGAYGINKKIRGPIFEEKYLEEIKEKFKRESEKKIESIARDIQKCLEFTGGNEYAVQLEAQFIKVQNKFNTFRDILNRKLYQGELAYGEFYNTAEQLCGSVLDNVEKVVMTMKIVDEIDLDYLEKRYDAIEDRMRKKEDSEHDRKEIKVLQQQIDLREDKLEEIDRVLTSNEEALAEMDKITFALSEITTKAGHSNKEFDSALKDMKKLTEKVGMYETK